MLMTNQHRHLEREGLPVSGAGFRKCDAASSIRLTRTVLELELHS
jgi:hypothetical protein